MSRLYHFYLKLVLFLITIKLALGYKIIPPSSPHFASAIISSTPHSAHSPSNGGGLNLPKITLLNVSNEYSDPYYAGLGQNAQLEDLLFQNETVFIVPSSRLALVYQCEANYPVFWNLAHSKVVFFIVKD